MKNKLFAVILILLSSIVQCISKDTFSDTKRTIDIFEYENDSLICQLNFELIRDRMKINFLVQNKITNAKYNYSGNAKMFIHALNTEQVFVDEYSNDTLILNQYYFVNKKGYNEFAIAIDALTGKAFIFDIQSKSLKNIGELGMLRKVFNDTTRLACNEMVKGASKEYPISYWIKYENEKTQEENFNLYLINDVSAIFKNANERIDHSLNIHDGVCLHLLTEQKVGKKYPKIIHIDKIGAIIPAKIHELSFFSHNYFLKYEGEEVNIYISASDYSILIFENKKRKQFDYMFLVGQYSN